MKFYRAFTRVSVVFYGIGLVGFALINRSRGESPRISVLNAFFLLLVLFVMDHFLVFWKISPDRVEERRVLRHRTIAMSEIACVGPASRRFGDRPAVRNWIEVRSTQGQKWFAQPADPAAFIEEMKKFAPTVTLNL